MFTFVLYWMLYNFPTVQLHILTITFLLFLFSNPVEELQLLKKSKCVYIWIFGILTSWRSNGPLAGPADRVGFGLSFKDR